MKNESIRFYHLNYQIDKKRYSDWFWDNYRNGEWQPHFKRMYWWKLYKGVHEATKELQEELNISGMNNFPRYQYQFANHALGAHIDEDNLTGILFNLREKENIICIRDVPYHYQAAVTHVGKYVHSVPADTEDRLVLKFSNETLSLASIVALAHQRLCCDAIT